MQLTEENKNLVISKVYENEVLTEKMNFFESNFSKSKSFILGIGSDKQLYKIIGCNSYEALLHPEQKNINKMQVIGVVASIVILIALILMGVSPGWSLTGAIVLPFFLILGTKKMHHSLESRRIFKENKEDIEEFYSYNAKTYENIGFILDVVGDSIVAYAQTQQIVSLDEVKKNGFQFLPDLYISLIMDMETDDGKYEKIEVSNFQSGADGNSYLYKSKISSRPITSTILDID